MRNIRDKALTLLCLANKKPKSLQTKTRQAVRVPNLEANLLEFLNYGKARVFHCKTRQTPDAEQADVNYRVHENRCDDVTY